MKKIVLAVTLLCSGVFVAKAQTYSGGSGTKSDPYLIATKADLKYLSETDYESKNYFLQTADLFFNSTDFEIGGDFYNNGEGFIPLGVNSFGFEGCYNGGGHIIDSLYINRPNGEAAFIKRTYSNDTFGFISLTNVNITGDIHVGGFVGQVYWGSVMNCYVSGVINGNDRVGGIAGASSSTVRFCYSSASLNSVKIVGGLIGENGGGSIYDSYATGAITGGNFVGGLCGRTSTSGKIRNCYSTGVVTGTTNAGGLIGSDGSTVTQQSYWNTQTSGMLTSEGGSPKTTQELQSQGTFVGWNFAQDWKMGNCITNNGYPILYFQTLNIPNAAVNFSVEAKMKNDFCSGGSKAEIELIVTGNSDYNYSWSSGDYKPTATNLKAGTYTVLVTDKANCGTIDTSFDIISEPYFDAQAQANASAVCDSGTSTITLSKSAYGAKYYLRNASNDSLIEGPVLGTGGAVAFTSDKIYSTTSYTILGATLNYGNSIDTAFMNALEFTGNTDMKQVSLGDSLWINHFQGNTAFTLETWVNRSSLGNLHTIFSNYSGSYPILFRIDYDKISLFVNSSASVQGNSIIPAGVWTHLAATYDGATLKVYVNGMLDGIKAFTSPLQATSSPLRIGGGLANNTEFFLGSIADLRLWDIAKSAEEIQAQMNERLTGTESGLVANYQFNEGSDSTTANAVAANAQYSGRLINSPAWVSGPVLTQMLCSEEFSTVVTATVGTVHPSAATTVNGLTITASESGASYQWIDCDNGNIPINGETNRSFTATVNGNYAVIVDNGICQETSTCVSINSVGIIALNKAALQIYPNPSQGNLIIRLKNSAQVIQSVQVLNLLGKEVYQAKSEQNQVNLNLSGLASGVYIVQVQVDDMTIIERIILE